MTEGQSLPIGCKCCKCGLSDGAAPPAPTETKCKCVECKCNDFAATTKNCTCATCTCIDCGNTPIPDQKPTCQCTVCKCDVCKGKEGSAPPPFVLPKRIECSCKVCTCIICSPKGGKKSADSEAPPFQLQARIQCACDVCTCQICDKGGKSGNKDCVCKTGADQSSPEASAPSTYPCLCGKCTCNDCMGIKPGEGAIENRPRGGADCKLSIYEQPHIQSEEKLLFQRNMSKVLIRLPCACVVPSISMPSGISDSQKRDTKVAAQITVSEYSTNHLQERTSQGEERPYGSAENSLDKTVKNSSEEARRPVSASARLAMDNTTRCLTFNRPKSVDNNFGGKLEDWLKHPSVIKLTAAINQDKYAAGQMKLPLSCSAKDLGDLYSSCCICMSKHLEMEKTKIQIQQIKSMLNNMSLLALRESKKLLKKQTAASSQTISDIKLAIVNDRSVDDEDKSLDGISLRLENEENVERKYRKEKSKPCKCGRIHAIPDNTNVDLSTFEIVDIKKINYDSILIEWNPPKSKLIIGYDIVINGERKTTVMGNEKRYIVLHAINHLLTYQIMVFAVTKCGLCKPPAVAIYTI